MNRVMWTGRCGRQTGGVSRWRAGASAPCAASITSRGFFHVTFTSLCLPSAALLLAGHTTTRFRIFFSPSSVGRQLVASRRPQFEPTAISTGLWADGAPRATWDKRSFSPYGRGSAGATHGRAGGLAAGWKREEGGGGQAGPVCTHGRNAPTPAPCDMVPATQPPTYYPQPSPPSSCAHAYLLPPHCAPVQWLMVSKHLSTTTAMRKILARATPNNGLSTGRNTGAGAVAGTDLERTITALAYA